jgi:hypothetical protein
MSEPPHEPRSRARWGVVAAVVVASTGALAGFAWLFVALLGIDHPMFMFCVHFLTMAWATAILDTWKPALRAGWFEPKAFERGGRLYRGWGALAFQSLLRRIGWERLIRGRGARFGVGAESASARVIGARYSEAAHLMGIVVSLPLLAWMAAARDPLAIAYYVAWTLLLHVYPVILQRHNRPRYARVAAREARRRSAPDR